MNLQELISKHNLKIKGIIQIGASIGEEVDMFKNSGIENTIYIDADPLTMDELKAKVGDKAYHTLLWDKSNEVVNFHLADFLACSTANEVLPGIATAKDIELTSITLKDFLAKNNLDPDTFNMLFIDCEGSEIRVFKGADLSKIDYIYTEYQTTYENSPENLKAFLKDFEEVERTTILHQAPQTGSWGDILFVRKTTSK